MLDGFDLANEDALPIRLFDRFGLGKRKDHRVVFITCIPVSAPHTIMLHILAPARLGQFSV